MASKSRPVSNPEFNEKSRALFLEHNGTITEGIKNDMVKCPWIPSPIQLLLTSLTARYSKIDSGTRIDELGFCNDQVAKNNFCIGDKNKYIIRRVNFTKNWNGKDCSLLQITTRKVFSYFGVINFRPSILQN